MESANTEFRVVERESSETVRVGAWRVPARISYTTNTAPTDAGGPLGFAFTVDVECEPVPKVVEVRLGRLEGGPDAITRAALLEAAEFMADVAIRALMLGAKPSPYDLALDVNRFDSETLRSLEPLAVAAKAEAEAEADGYGVSGEFEFDVPARFFPLYKLLRNRQRLRSVDLERVADLYREAERTGQPTSTYVAANLPIAGGKDTGNQARQLASRARKAGYLAPPKRS